MTARQYLLTETEVDLAQTCLELTERGGGELYTKLSVVLSSFDNDWLDDEGNDSPPPDWLVTYVDGHQRGVGLTDDEVKELRYAAQEYLLTDDSEYLGQAEQSLLTKLKI